MNFEEYCKIDSIVNISKMVFFQSMEDGERDKRSLSVVLIVEGEINLKQSTVTTPNLCMEERNAFVILKTPWKSNAMVLQQNLRKNAM